MLEPPRTLPGVTNLSLSSIRLFLQCPEKWKRRHIDGEPDFPSGAALVGSSVGAAEGANYAQKIGSGEDLPERDVLDLYADEFDLRAEREPVDWRDDKPGRLKDQGARILPVYHRLVAPHVRPKAVEREFMLSFDGVDWGFRGYIDVEDTDDTVIDMKVRGRALSQQDADTDLQPTAYLLAKRAEGGANGFAFHPMVRTQSPEPKHVQPVHTDRSDPQLDAFVSLVYRVATEIHWRAENDVWAGAPPGSWWCSEKWCGFWRDCPYGGLHRSPVALPQATVTA